MPAPGAATSTAEPKLEKLARLPLLPIAATVTVLAQLAGEKLLALEVLLPAATTIVVPRATASSILDCQSGEHAP
jgi:hypothetical protein